MRRQMLSVTVALLAVTALAGCGSGGLGGLLGSWGELGDETTVGPYRFQPPKRFTRDTKASAAPGVSQCIFRGPSFGKSEPGIILSYQSHQHDFSAQGPNWTEAVRMGLQPLRMKFTNWSQSTGSVTTINGLPGVRFQFSGDLTLKGETRGVQGVGYLLIDDAYLMVAIGMDTGPQAASSTSKFEKSLLTLTRPDATTRNVMAGGGGSSASSGSLAQNSRYPGSGRQPDAGDSDSGYPVSSREGGGNAGRSYPGSGYPSSSHSSGLSSSGGAGYSGGRPSSGHSSGLSRSGGTGYPGAGMGGRGLPGGGGMSGYPDMAGGMRGPAGASGRGNSFGGGEGEGEEDGEEGGGYSGYPGSSGGGNNPSMDSEEMKRRADAAQRASALAITAADASHPEYLGANIELLQIGSEVQKTAALQRLGKASEGDISGAGLRDQLAGVLCEVVKDPSAGLGARREATAMMVQWNAADCVPILTDLLQDPHPFLQIDALDQLTQLEDERAIEPVTQLFVANAQLRDKAGDCLRVFGSAAEGKVLELSRPSDVHLTRATVQLLGDIGTSKSLGPFRLLRSLPFYSLVKTDVSRAEGKIRRRDKGAK